MYTRTRGHVLRGVADQGQEDHAYERLAHAVGLRHAVDRVHLFWVVVLRVVVKWVIREKFEDALECMVVCGLSPRATRHPPIPQYPPHRLNQRTSSSEKHDTIKATANSPAIEPHSPKSTGRSPVPSSSSSSCDEERWLREWDSCVFVVLCVPVWALRK